jgi:hypothetical protein
VALNLLTRFDFGFTETSFLIGKRMSSNFWFHSQSDAISSAPDVSFMPLPSAL